MDIDFEMDEDDQSSDMSEFSGHKRRNESSCESDLEDQLTNFEDYQLLDILAENTIKVNDEYVLRIDQFTDIDIGTKFSCKILKFSADWDYQDVLSALNRLNRFEYPNLFIFIIEIENAGLKNYENTSKRTKMSSKVDEVTDILNGFAENRPLILQVKSIEEGLTNFYYKDQTHPVFNIVNFEQNSDDAFDFTLFLNAFLYGVVENVIDSVIQRLEANQDCSLILRFLRTLELSENIWCKLILKCAAYGSKNDFFAVLDIPFGSDGKVLSSTAEKWISKVIKEETIIPEEDQNLPTDAVEVDELSSEQQACSQVLLTESSILLKTIQYPNEEIINLLIKYCTHLIQELPLEHKINISTSAFNNKQFNVLYKLLNNSDYPFPDEFTADGIVHMQLVKLIEERKNFKDTINTGDMNAIKNFVKNHPSLKTAYSLENDSALLLSVIASNFEAYYYLKSQGFLLPELENLKEAQLSEETLKIANNFMLKQREKNINDGLTNQQKVINILCNKSLIHNRNTSIENEAEYRRKIRKWFEDVYKIDYCVDMLNVAASCEDLKLIFDFESVTVNNVYLDELGSFGTTKALKKWIFIGAESSNSERDQKIKGIIAHEICHYVMYLIFENSGNPYYKYQTKIKETFEKIAKGIIKLTVNTFGELNDECDGIISTVLQLHRNEKFYAELIVRVVHILAQFDNDENLTKIQSFYKELFDFWIKCVLPEIKNFNQKSRKYKRKMNRVARLLDHIKSYKLEFVASKYIEAKNSAIKNNNIVIVTTNVPKLLLIDIYKYLYSQHQDLFDTKSVFIDPVEIRNPEIFEDFKNLLEKTSELNIFVDCSFEACEKLQQVTLNPASHILFIVINKNQAEKVKQNLPKSNFQVIETEVNYNRNDLDTASQKLLLQTKINFQYNSQISLLDLITKSPSPTKSSTSETTDYHNEMDAKDTFDVINNHLLNLVLDKKQITINQVLEDSSDFRLLYQPRRFLISWHSNYSEDELLSKIKNEKYVLISDIAGNGKSWAIKNISKTLMHQNSTSWVTYVDLKQFVKEFKSQKDEKLKFSTFLIEKILKLKADKFEAKIFQKMYEIGKVFIIFDGFDEIAPDYAEFVSKLAVLFEQNGGNQLWIATRNHFRIDLQKILQINKAYQLNNFSTENGAELIAKSWMLNEPEIKKITSKDKFDKHLEESIKYKEFLKIAKKLIEKVSMSKYRSIGMPQIYTIIAKISKDNKEVTLSYGQTKMYETLVDILYERWSTQKGEIRKQANVKSQKYELNFYKFHQCLAIKSLFFEYVGVFFPGYNGTEWPTDEIIAGGIVDINNGKINFLHETFREYFVADFITMELKKDSHHPEVLNMFAEVMTTEKFGVIRMFLNDSLEMQILQNIEPEMQTHKCMKMFQDMDSFADIFNRDLDNLIEFIVQYLKTRKGGKISRILINSASQVLANPSQFSKFQEFLFTHCNVEFLEKLITEKNIFLYLIELGHKIENFEEFVTKMEAKVGRELVKEGLKQKIQEQGNIFYFLCKSPNLSFEKFKLFLQLITKFFTTEEIFNLMLNCDEDQTTILQVIFTHSNIEEPLKIWSEIKNFFIAQNQENLFKKLVSKEDSKGRNILHYSLYLYIDQYKQFLEQMFELKILKEMITKVNSDGNSFMHALMEEEVMEDAIEHTFMFFELKFGAVELGKFLKAKNNRNKTVFEVAVQNRINNCRIYKTLWQLLKQACGTDKEFLEIISENSQDSRNILQVVAQNDSTNEVLEFMIEELEKFDACDEIRKLLSNHARDCPILLRILTYKEEHFELYKKLWKVYHKNFDLSKFLFKGSGSFLSDVISHKNKEFFEYTWNAMKSLRNQYEPQIAHCLRIEHWKNDLLELSYKICPEVHEWIQNIQKEYKTDFEIQIFPEFSEKFDNCINQNSNDQLEKLLTEYEKIFEHQSLLQNFKYFLMMPDSESRSFVHRAIFCDNVEINKVLWKRILNISDWNELKSLQKQNPILDEILQIFTDTDWHGISILHSAVAYSTVDVFKLLIEILEALASKDEIKDILKSWQKYWNLLYKAAEFNESPELHVELWKFLEKYCNSQEIIEFLLKNDGPYDYDSLQTAVENNTKEIVELTWNKYKSFLDRDKQVEYLSKNFDKLLKLAQENDINMTEVQEWLQNIIIQYPEIIKGLKIKENDDDDRSKSKFDFVKESLMSMDQNGNIFYYLCNSASSEDFSVEEYLETLHKYLNPEKILDLMKNCNRNGENIFHVCVRAGNASELVKWLKDVRNFTQSNNLLYKRNELLFQTNSNNYNFLDLTVDNNSFEFHKTIWNCLKDLLTNYGILNICVCKNEDNFIHFLLQNNGNPQIIEHIFNIFKSKLTEAEFVEIINSRGHLGTNLLQAAVMNTKNIEIFKIMWNLLLDFYKTDFPQILTAVDDIGRNIISVAACHSSGNHFDLLIDYLKSKMSIIEIKEMLFSLSTRQSPLHYAACNNEDLTLHEALWTHFSQHFSEPEIKEIINYVDQDGNNLLHCAVRWNAVKIVELTWNKIENYLDPNEQVEYLNSTGYEGKNLFEMSLLNEEHPNVQEWIQHHRLQFHN